MSEYFDEGDLNDFGNFIDDMDQKLKESNQQKEVKTQTLPKQSSRQTISRTSKMIGSSNNVQQSQPQQQQNFNDFSDDLLNDVDNLLSMDEPVRESRNLLEYSNNYVNTENNQNSMPKDSSINVVDDLLVEMQHNEGSILAHETDLIVNWDSVTNCLIEFISLFCKTLSGSLPENEKSEFQELGDYYLSEVKLNWEKFPFWLVTLDNENVVTLHSGRNQTKESAESLVKAVSQYNQLSDQRNQKALLTRVQTAVADCWSFYEATNINWGYDSVVFKEIEVLVKVIKRLFASAKCESGEDWTMICLESLQIALKVERIGNFVAFSKKNLNLQIDIGTCCIMITKIIKKTQTTGDIHRVNFLFLPLFLNSQNSCFLLK